MLISDGKGTFGRPCMCNGCEYIWFQVFVLTRAASLEFYPASGNLDNHSVKKIFLFFVRDSMKKICSCV